MEENQTKREGRTFWMRLVEEFERTEGVSQPQFARRHGVKCATFRHWLYALRKEKSEQAAMVPARFVEITPRALPAHASPRPNATVVEVGGVRLLLETLPDPGWVAELAARTRSC